MDKQIAARMAQERRAKAKEYLSYYIGMIARGAGVPWTPDNDGEVETVVDAILDAAKYTRMADETATN